MVVSLTSSSGGYINGRNSANLELLIDKTSSISLPRSSSSELGLHLPKQSLPISTNFQGSISAHCEVVLDITLYD